MYVHYCRCVTTRPPANDGGFINLRKERCKKHIRSMVSWVGNLERCVRVRRNSIASSATLTTFSPVNATCIHNIITTMHTGGRIPSLRLARAGF